MMNDYDEVDEDYAYVSDDILHEIEEDRKLNIINKFKDHIQKEPEFYGINGICSYEILHFIEKFNHCKREKNVLTDYQIKLIDELYIALYSKLGNVYIYNKISNIIFRRVYV